VGAAYNNCSQISHGSFLLEENNPVRKNAQKVLAFRRVENSPSCGVLRVLISATDQRTWTLSNTSGHCNQDTVLVAS